MPRPSHVNPEPMSTRSLTTTSDKFRRCVQGSSVIGASVSIMARDLDARVLTGLSANRALLDYGATPGGSRQPDPVLRGLIVGLAHPARGSPAAHPGYAA